MKNPNEFRKMNCDDCQCNICLGSCMFCYICYRAEYAKEEYEDFYYPDDGSNECHEF